MHSRMGMGSTYLGEEFMKLVRAFLNAHGTPERVDLLPYHAMGEHKYDALGMNVSSFRTPNEEEMTKLKSCFR